jgi:predicted naringenin-chalcone synthase
MSYILNISTAVPEYRIEREELMDFYRKAFASESPRFFQKINFLEKKTNIATRYSCIPDYQGKESELYTDGNYEQPLEKRMELYKDKIIPLSCKAVDGILLEAGISSREITHLLTVSCTGMFAPGIEFLIAKKYGLEHTEKSALNFLGCYAALKAMKQAHYITESNPQAIVLVVCAELCSLHFHPSVSDEEMIANLLFADGAAAMLLCGEKNKHAKDKLVLKIDGVGSAFFPDTADLMTWQLSSSAFRMHLSQEVVRVIKEQMGAAAKDFLANTKTDYWAIHPGGVKIVEAARESLGLKETDTTDALQVLKEYGNMSSPTVLFVLKRIFDRIRQTDDDSKSRKIFSCAFGPGLNMEMVRLSSVNTRDVNKFNYTTSRHAVQV